MFEKAYIIHKSGCLELSKKKKKINPHTIQVDKL